MTNSTNLPRGELRRIHAASESSILGQALGQIPGYVDARQRLDAFPAPVNAPGLSEVDSRPLIDGVVLAAISDGLALDSPEVRIAAANAHAEAQGLSLIASSVERLRRQDGDELDSLVRGNVGKILTFLNTRLQEVLTAARGLLNQLGSIDDFDRAERAGRIEELRELRVREAEYRSIREAQHLVMAKVVGDVISKAPAAHVQLPVAGDVEHVLGLLGVSLSGSGVIRPARSSLPADWTTPEALRWCVKYQAARPWVPTVREFRDAQERQTAQLQQAREWLGQAHLHRDRREPFDANKLPELQRHLTSAHATANV